MDDDQALLRAFAEGRSQEAFTALVQRHLPMIFAAARRQVGDAHRAEEIAVQAFTLLARKASTLQRHPALGGWLYTTTGNLAARWRRSEGRRARREQDAQVLHETPEGEIDQEALQPVIDGLLLALPERDRLAVLLRYFENRSHAEVGRQLGLSENAARMRVDRALERLREALRRRGIASTSAALAAGLTAQATATPPASLAVSIATSASAATAAGGLFVLMQTPLLKTAAVAAAVSLGVSGLLWQWQENRRLRLELAAAETELAARRNPAPPRVQPVATDDSAGSDFVRLNARLPALQATPAESWQERADVLRELMSQLPEFQIPELDLATPEDWLDATKQPPVTEQDYRRALAQVRHAVTMRFGNRLFEAIRAYRKDHNDAFPPSAEQLESYLADSTERDALQRYKVVPSSRYPNLQVGKDLVLTLKSPVDPDYDQVIVVGAYGTATTPYRSLVIQPVVEAYRAANAGKLPTRSADLLPYAKTNAQRSAIRVAIGMDKP